MYILCLYINKCHNSRYIFNNHFYIDKMTTLKYQCKGCFSVSIKLSKISQKSINKTMNTFLRYLVYCFIVLYIIGWWIRLALSRMMEYILGSQGTHEGVVVRRHKSLPWIYLIRINAKDVDIEPRFLPLVPDRFKT